MNDQDREALIAVIREAMATDEHKAHHAFVADLIEERRRKREFRDNIKKQVVGWAIIAMLGSIGTAVYHVWDVIWTARK